MTIPLDLEEYFSDASLVAKLCRKRVDRARVNRREQFISKVSGHSFKKQSDELLEMMPPRRHWSRPTRKERRNSEHLPTVITQALKRQVLRELSRSKPRYPWVENLRVFLDKCRERALGWKPTDSYKPERINAIPKIQPGNGQKYRLIAAYNFSDNLIGSAFAAYLRDIIDPVLGPVEPGLGTWCYAFRSSQNGRPLTHHDAVATLRNFTSSLRDNRVVPQ